MSRRLNGRRMSTATVLALVGLLLSTASSFAATVTFKYTGEEQTFTVPAGVTSVHVTATGAIMAAVAAALPMSV